MLHAQSGQVAWSFPFFHGKKFSLGPSLETRPSVRPPDRLTDTFSTKSEALGRWTLLTTIVSGALWREKKEISRDIIYLSTTVAAYIQTALGWYVTARIYVYRIIATSVDYPTNSTFCTIKIRRKNISTFLMKAWIKFSILLILLASNEGKTYYFHVYIFFIDLYMYLFLSWPWNKPTEKTNKQTLIDFLVTR